MSYSKKDRNHLHSIEELAEWLQCSYWTAYKLKRSGNIPYIQYGKKVVFDKQQVWAALQQGRSAV